MASPSNAIVCALIATSFWSLFGYALARRLVPHVLAVGAGPVIGWSVHSALTLPIYLVFGFSIFAVISVGGVCIIVAGFLLLQPSATSDTDGTQTIPISGFVLAAILALIPAATLLPKSSGDAVWLADPIFDHAKIALIDAMTRLGLPPVNPVFAEVGQPSHLVYYYLWHFSAAEIALITPISGWEADIGLTWFTALASLILMMGLAVWLSNHAAAAVWVVVLAAAGSIWPLLSWISHAKDVVPVLLPSIGMAGWLFQATWVPQHLMAATCLVTAMVLVTRHVVQPSFTLALTIGLLIAAGFGSSAFVGGITCGLAALLSAPMLLAHLSAEQRPRFLAGLAIAALLVVCLIVPFVRDQWAAVQARGGGGPIIFEPYRVFDGLFPIWLRRMLDIPGYWFVVLPIELPAVFIPGTIVLLAALRSIPPQSEKLVIAVFACLAAAALGISWLLMSTLGNNNDLGLRAIVPAEIVLIVVTAAAIAGMPNIPRRSTIAVAALIGFILSAPDFLQTIHDNIVAPRRPPDAKIFAEAPEVWAAARRYTPPDARIANNPLFLKDLTPWPVNISWALLANRSSCFAGREMAIPFAPLPSERRFQINATFLRVFAGEGTADDVHQLATRYGCGVVVVVPQDSAWDSDPFALAPDYSLAETRDGHWRIYVRRH
jgi:hypothetical protein